jgi:hypothetical protein
VSDDKELREVILKEVDTVASRLENGEGDNPKLLAQGVALSLRLLRPLVERVTVSDSECKQRMATCPARAILSGNVESAKSAAFKVIAGHSPWFLFVAYLIYEIATKHQ